MARCLRAVSRLCHRVVRLKSGDPFIYGRGGAPDTPTLNMPHPRVFLHELV